MSVNTWLNYHHLYYFKIIAEEGSIVLASKRLRIGQPALSMQLKQFEDVIGHKLFERRNKRLFLTEIGKIVLTYAKDIFHLGVEMLDTINDKAIPKKIKLQIGVQDAVPKSITTQVAHFARQVEDCSLSITEGNVDELLGQLLSHQLDILILNSTPPIKDKSIVLAKKILQSPLILCGTKEFFGLKKKFPESLSNAPIILPSIHSKIRHDIEHFCEHRGIQLNIFAEVQDSSMKKKMAVEGLGVLPIMKLAAQELISEKKLYELGTFEGIIDEAWLVVAKRKIRNPLCHSIIQDFNLVSD